MGTYPITVTGNGGGVQQTATVTLTVTAAPNFTISASPASLSIVQGNQGTSPSPPPSVEVSTARSVCRLRDAVGHHCELQSEHDTGAGGGQLDHDHHSGGEHGGGDLSHHGDGQWRRDPADRHRHADGYTNVHKPQVCAGQLLYPPNTSDDRERHLYGGADRRGSERRSGGME